MNIKEYVWISIEKKLSTNVQKHNPNQTQASNIKMNETYKPPFCSREKDLHSDEGPL